MASTFQTETSADRVEYHIEIGRNTAPSESYIVVKFTPRNTRGNYTLYQQGDVNGDGYFDYENIIPKIQFRKRRNKGFSIDYENRTFFVSFEGKGHNSSTGENSQNKNENLGRLRGKLLYHYDTYLDVLGPEAVHFDMEIDLFGDENDIVPYNPSVDNGEDMFSRFVATPKVVEGEVTSVSGPGFDEGYSPDDMGTYTEPPNFYTVDDPDGVSSSFADLQKDVCIKAPVEDEFGTNVNPDLKRICPTCIPNPDYVPPNWYEQEGVWLNEKTCNYTYRVPSVENYFSFTSDNELKEKYIRQGIVSILIGLGKQIIDEDICWSPPTSAGEECQDRIKQSIIDQYIEIYETPTGELNGTTFTVYRLNPSIYNDYQIINPIALEIFARAASIKPASYTAPGLISEADKAYIEVTVPANLIDLIPQDLLAQESEENQQELQSTEEIILKGAKIKRAFKKVLPKLFKSYSEYQSFYRNVEGGHIRIATDFDPETLETKMYYFSKFKKQFGTFYSDFKQLLESNGYKLYSDDYGSSSSFKSNSKYTGAASQKLVSSGQKYKEAFEVKIIFDKSDRENPFKISSVKAKYKGCPFYRCGAGLSDFIEKYNEKPTLMAYVASSNDMMYEIENSKQLPPWRDFAVKYTSPELTFETGDPDGNPDAESCLDDQESTLNDLILDAEMSFTKAVEYAFNSMNCREFSKYDPEEYMKIMGGLRRGTLGPAIQTYAQEESKAYNKALQGYGDYYQTITSPDSAIAKFYKKLQKPEKEASFFERLSGKTIEEAMSNLRNKDSRKEFIGELLDKINPCNWEAITFDIINCLLKGLNPAEALQTAAKSLLNSQNPEAWEKIFVGLSPEQQAKIKSEIEANFGGLPTPWEFKKQQEKKGVVKLNDYEAQRQPPQNPGDLTQKENSELLNALGEFDEEVGQMEVTLSDLAATETRLLLIIQDLFEIRNPLSEMSQEDIDFNEQDYIDELEMEDIEFFQTIGVSSATASYDDFINAARDVDEQLNNIESQITERKSAKSDYTNDIIQGIEDDRFKNDVNVYERAVQNVLRVLIESYTQALINSFAMDELRSLIDSLPGSEIYATILATASCPNTARIDEYLDDVIGGIELNPCMGKNGWYFPEIPIIPGFSWLDVLRFLLLKFIDEIITRIFSALTKYLLKTMQKILSRACDVLAGLGRTLLGNDDTDLLDAIADAFCTSDRFTPFGESQEDAGIRDDAVNTLNDFIYRYTNKTLEEDPTIEWVTRVSENVNSYQFLNIFVQGIQPSDPIFQAIWEATQETEMANIIRTEEDLQELFDLISSYLTPQQQSDILGLLENHYEEFNTSEDGELTYAEFCKKYFCLEIDAGFDDDEDEDGNTGVKSDLEDIFDSFLNGPGGEIDDILSDISLDPGGDPFCQDLNDPDDPIDVKGTKGPQMPPELKEFQKALSDAVFADLESAYISDTIEDRGSFFNNVLADEDNIPLVKGSISPHENRVRRVVLFPNAANTVEEHKDKYDDAPNILRRIMHLFDFRDEGVSISSDDDDYPTPTNLFPSSVGLWLQTQVSLLHTTDANYATSIYLEQETQRVTTKKEWKRFGFTSNNIVSFERFRQKPDLQFAYRDRNGGDHFTWGFDLNYNSVSLEENDQGVLTYQPDRLRYELELIEYIATAPPTGFKKSLLKLLPAVVEEEYTIDQEYLFNLNVPISTTGFEEVYEKYKSDSYAVAIDKDSLRFRKNHQEEAFLNFLLADPQRSDIINDGIFYENAGFTDVLGYAEEITLAFKYISKTNTIYGKMKDMFAKKLLWAIYTARPTSAELAGEGANAFVFGYDKKSEINYQDLIYVNPDADPTDSSTWKYTYKEGDKVIGKSATENPRVVFLDPEIYGGSYKKPKIYIHPYPYKGWLGIMQAFNPDLDGCSPKRSGWLFLGEVTERVSKLENSLKKDKRMGYDPDCVKKAPYDLIADSSTHAYIDGIVTTTIRTYIVENLLKTMPTLASLRFNSQNYDLGMGIFLMNRMENEMKDFPKKRNSGNISKMRYWYLFLEQMVQTVERRIITGEITKDEDLDALFEKIIEVRKKYYYPTKKDRKILKRITKVAFDSDGFVDYLVYDYGQGATKTLRPGDTLFSKLSGFIDAVSFNAFGEEFRQILKNITDFGFKAGKITLKDLRLYTKVYDIYLSEDVAIDISSRLILNEFNAYQHKIQKYLPDQPYIQDLNKFILNPKSGLTIGPPINVGTKYDVDIDSTVRYPYGDVISVVDDPKTDHPLQKLSEYMSGLDGRLVKIYGAFYLEKYVVVEPNQIAMINNEDFANQFKDIQRKPISVEKFQEAFGRFKQSVSSLPGMTNSTEELFISDLFGNAIRNDDDESYEGSIGIRFGVRLSYLPPEGFSPGDIDHGYSNPLETTGTDLLLEPNERQYYYKTLPGYSYDSESFRFPIPLVNYEQDLPDKKIKDFYSYQVNDLLKCYIDKLTETPEYKFLMNYVFNVKSFATMSSIYSYYGFPDSIGEHVSERGEFAKDANKGWIDDTMRKTKKKCYNLFKKYYNVQGFNKEESTDQSHSDSMRALSGPDINLNLKRNIRWWQERRFYDRPFNEEGRECDEGATAAFDQNESKPPRTDTNDYANAAPQQDFLDKLDVQPTPEESDKEEQETFLSLNPNNAFTMSNYDD